MLGTHDGEFSVHLVGSPSFARRGLTGQLSVAFLWSPPLIHSRDRYWGSVGTSLELGEGSLIS